MRADVDMNALVSLTCISLPLQATEVEVELEDESSSGRRQSPLWALALLGALGAMVI